MANTPFNLCSTRRSDLARSRALGIIVLAAVCGCTLMVGNALANEPELSDPMRPNWYGIKGKSKRSDGRPHLSSIIASDERRLAVVNGELMREGELKNGVLLRQVLPDRVLVVTADQRLYALKLAAPSVTKEN